MFGSIWQAGLTKLSTNKDFSIFYIFPQVKQTLCSKVCVLIVNNRRDKEAIIKPGF